MALPRVFLHLNLDLEVEVLDCVNKNNIFRVARDPTRVSDFDVWLGNGMCVLK